jgi:hypothetical protein
MGTDSGAWILRSKPRPIWRSRPPGRRCRRKRSRRPSRRRSSPGAVAATVSAQSARDDFPATAPILSDGYHNARSGTLGRPGLLERMNTGRPKSAIALERRHIVAGEQRVARQEMAMRRVTERAAISSTTPTKLCGSCARRRTGRGRGRGSWRCDTGGELSAARALARSTSQVASTDHEVHLSCGLDLQHARGRQNVDVTGDALQGRMAQQRVVVRRRSQAFALLSYPDVVSGILRAVFGVSARIAALISARCRSRNATR